MAYDVHISRTRDWMLAHTNPIEISEVELLVNSDPELAWMPSYSVTTATDGRTEKHTMIAWRGTPSFWWYCGELRCSRPLPAQIAKLVRMAQLLKAHATGDDGEQYELMQDPLHGERLVTTRPKDG